MPGTTLQDVIVPELFNPYVINRTMELSALYQSGIITNTSEFDALASQAAPTVNMPFFEDLTGESEQVIEGEDLADNKITSNKDVATILRRAKMWSATDLSAPLAGTDPMMAIGTLVARFWERDMQKELIKIKNELGITFVFVTHDQEEALTMSDRIIVMNQGLIQQIGTPVDIYNEPENAFVADFIGESNIIDGVMPKDFLVEILGIPFPCVDSGFGRNELVDVVIRPEDMEFQEPGSGMLDGRVTSILFKGVHYEMKVQAGGFEWLAHSTEAYHPGTEVGIYVKPENIQIMHKPTSAAQEVINTNE